MFYFSIILFWCVFQIPLYFYNNLIVPGIQKQHNDVLYASITAVNSVGLNTTAFSGPISVDDTPPVAGRVVELANNYRVDSGNSDITVALNLLACEDTKGMFYWGDTVRLKCTGINIIYIISSIGQRPEELMRWQFVHRPSSGDRRPSVNFWL